jgi:hypothetical protein
VFCSKWEANAFCKITIQIYGIKARIWCRNTQLLSDHITMTVNDTSLESSERTLERLTRSNYRADRMKSNNRDDRFGLFTDFS